MSELTPQECGELHEILKDAFDLVALKQLVLFNFPYRLDDIVGPGAGRDEAAFNLLERTIEHGELEPLLRSALRARPNRADLVTFCRNHIPQALDPANVEGLVGEVKKGLTAVAQTDIGIAAFAEAGDFKATFRAAQRQMTIMEGYKTLHDELHSLQLRLASIELAASQVGQSTSAPAARVLTREVVYLRSAAARVRGIACSLPNGPPELYWIEQLEEAVTDLDQAPRQGDGARAVQATAGLRQILQESFRIEGLIAVAAREMQLGELIEALTAIEQQIEAKAGAASPIAIRVGKAVAALAILRPQLTAMISEHGEWQLLSKELIGLESKPGFSPSQKIPRWTRSVLPRLQGLCEVFQSEPWAQEVKTLVDAWEVTAAAANNETTEPSKSQQIEVAVTTAVQLEATCMTRFVDADHQLLALCGRLTEIGASLRAVLEK